MDRRDFLLLRHPMSARTVELSCERLHMSYLDSQSASQPRPAPQDGTSFAEPPAVLPSRDADAWLYALESELHGVDVIRVNGSEWLRPGDLRARVDAMLERLERRGVRIER